MSSLDWNLVPFREIFSLGKSWSHKGDSSEEYGAWRRTGVLCLAGKLCIKCEKWAGVLEPRIAHCPKVRPFASQSVTKAMHRQNLLVVFLGEGYTILHRQGQLLSRASYGQSLGQLRSQFWMMRSCQNVLHSPVICGYLWSGCNTPLSCVVPIASSFGNRQM